MSLAGYERHLQARAGPGPMTDAEEELARLKLEEVLFLHHIKSAIWRFLKILFFSFHEIQI